MSEDPKLYGFFVDFLQTKADPPEPPQHASQPGVVASRRAALSKSNAAFFEALSGADSAEISAVEAEQAVAALETLRVRTAVERDLLADLANSGLSLDRLNGLDNVLRAGDDRLIAVRRVPILSTQLNEALPAWTSGLATETVIGPVADAFGRDIWLHIFRIVRQVKFVRTPGGTPFLSVPHMQFASVFHTTAQSDHDLASGSLWVATSLFAGVTDDTYTGIRISGGKLRLSVPIAVNGDEVVIPESVTCTLDVALGPPARHTSGAAAVQPGADARASVFNPPDTLKIVVGPSGNRIEATAQAVVGAFGQDVSLAPAASAPEYLVDLNRLLVPMTPEVADFTVATSEAQDFLIDGTAQIASGGLALPASRISPALLGEAAGVGR